MTAYARVIGLGRAVGSKVVTNDDLAKIVDTSDEWVRSRTGIAERRFAADDETTGSLAIAAGREALCDAGVARDDIDLVIVATSTPEYLVFPSTACVVQEALGLSRAGAFDQAAACSGFVYSLITASQFIQTGAYRHVLVIGADTLSRYLDFTDRTTCVLFGDGAGAVVLGATDQPGGLLSFVLGADGSRAADLIVPAGGSHRPLSPEALDAHEQFIHMNGREVYRFSTSVPTAALEQAASAANVALADLDLVIAHQANQRILQTAAHNLGVPGDLFFSNVANLGNTSGASVPLAMYDARDAGRLKPGMRVGFMGFGAGLTWATAIWRW